MTTRQSAPPSSARVEQYPERPPRNNVQNSVILDDPAWQAALARHYGTTGGTLVMSEMPIVWTFSQRTGQLYPDLLIAFDVDRDAAIARRCFALDERGKPPDFVLEVASENTAPNDFRNKPAGYAAFGVTEYWRFDPTGGDYYPASLAGDRLVDGEYRPISVVKVDEERYWGHSDALNLDLCWERGQLRWYDPASQRYIANYDDQANARAAAEAQLTATEAELTTPTTERRPHRGRRPGTGAKAQSRQARACDRAPAEARFPSGKLEHCPGAKANGPRRKPLGRILQNRPTHWETEKCVKAETATLPNC